MAIIEYKNGVHDHPTGWEGFRVCVMGKSRKYKQKYLRTTDPTTKLYYPQKKLIEIRQKAILLHDQWQKEEQFIREMHDANISVNFTIDKPHDRPNPTITIQMHKCLNTNKQCFKTSVNGTRMTFHDAWNKLLLKYIDAFQPHQAKIKQMQYSKPTFDEMNKKRLSFNRRSEHKFSMKKLRRCFQCYT